MTIPKAYTCNQRIEAKVASRDFVPDGDIYKTVWREATWIRFENDVYSAKRYPQSLTKVAASWTENFVYFGFHCKYTVLNVYEDEDPSEERWELWNRDVVEVFINPDPDRVSHYYEFEVSPSNQWIDLEIDQTKDPFYEPAWFSGFCHATRIDSQQRYWDCEMSIPVGSLGVSKLSPGTQWRVNFYRADGLGDNSQRRLTSWCGIPGGTTFHTPTRFGLIDFVK